MSTNPMFVTLSTIAKTLHVTLRPFVTEEGFNFIEVTYDKIQFVTYLEGLQILADMVNYLIRVPESYSQELKDLIARAQDLNYQH